MAIPKLTAYALPTVADLPTNKVNWAFEPERAALLIHDMQEYFLNFWGENSPMMAQVVANIARLRDYCKVHNIPVYYTAQPKEQSDDDRALLNDMWGPGLMLHQLGFTLAELPAGLHTSKSQGQRHDIIQLGGENLATGLNGEGLFLFAGDQKDVDAIYANPLLAHLPAVQNKRVWALGTETFRLDYYSAMRVLDRLDSLFK